MSKKTEAIGTRVEPMDKLLLQQIADRKKLELSDIVRQALHELIRQETANTLATNARG